MQRKINFEIGITLIYLVLGVTWILSSDSLAKFLISDLDTLTQFQSFKGIVFVLLSSAVIFLLARHYRNQQQKIKKRLIKAKRKAEESERLKSAFLTNLSHEIRTPMNGILGFAELLEESEFKKEKHQEYLDYLKVSSERMLETISDIIEISQIESGQSKVKVSEFNLKELLNHLHNSYLPNAEKKGLKFILTDELPGHAFLLKTDEDKLNSILKNFLRNAIKFTREGTVELGSFSANNRVNFYVKDTGTGIPPNLHKKIFNRFTQGDVTLTRHYEGSGLGLSIAKAYAGQIEGEITLDSEEGKGSTFRLSVPQAI